MTTNKLLSLAVAASISSVLTVVSSQPANACSCIESPIGDRIARADVVFVGKMTNQTGNEIGVLSFEFMAPRFFKGDVAESVTVVSDQRHSCGVRFASDESFIVYASLEDSGGLRTGACSGNTRATPEATAELVEIAGPGRSATQTPPDPPPTNTPTNNVPVAQSKPNGCAGCSVSNSDAGGGVLLLLGLVLTLGGLRRRRTGVAGRSRIAPVTALALGLALGLGVAMSASCKKKEKTKTEPASTSTDETKQDDPMTEATEATETKPPVKAATIERARELTKKFVIVDGHIDLPWRLQKKLDGKGVPLEDPGLATKKGDFDHPRSVAGGLDVPFMSIYIPAKFQTDGGAKKKADSLIDLVEGLITAHPDKFARAHSPAEAVANHAAGKVSLAMGIENGAAIEKNLTNLEHFRKRGVRYITLTHSKDNLICDSSYDDKRTWKGLSAYGRKVVAEMNRLGIMIDISHVSDDAFHQVIEMTKTPVIASHSSARHFIPGFERNMSDKMITKLGKNGGVMMINFGSTFVSNKANKHNKQRKAAIDKFALSSKVDKDSDKAKAFEREWKKKHPFPFANASEVADHIDHAVKLAGIDHVGFGSDYDGVGDSLPTGLKDASTYPVLFKLLLERGYSDEDLEKLAGKNLLRVWQQVEAYASENGSAPPTIP